MDLSTGGEIIIAGGRFSWTPRRKFSNYSETSHSTIMCKISYQLKLPRGKNNKGILPWVTELTQSEKVIKTI